MTIKYNYTPSIELIQKEVCVPYSIALAIELLCSYELQIIKAFRKNPSLLDFEVQNLKLEEQLDKLK